MGSTPTTRTNMHGPPVYATSFTGEQVSGRQAVPGILIGTRQRRLRRGQPKLVSALLGKQVGCVPHGHEGSTPFPSAITGRAQGADGTPNLVSRSSSLRRPATHGGVAPMAEQTPDKRPVVGSSPTSPTTPSSYPHPSPSGAGGEPGGPHGSEVSSGRRRTRTAEVPVQLRSDPPETQGMRVQLPPGAARPRSLTVVHLGLDHGPDASMGRHPPCKRDTAGSIPVRSTNPTFPA